MPDLEDTHEGELDTSVEAAQGAEQTEAPPWGDDFKPEQAWRTITTQRESEKELKEELRRIREDEETRAELLKEWGYEVAADEDDSEDVEFEDDDPVAPLRSELEEIKAWKQQQESDRENAAITADIEAINEGSDWDLDDHDRAVIRAWAARDKKQFTRADLEQAHKDYIDRLEGLAAKAVERAKKPKPKAASVTPAGKAATGTKPIQDMTPDEHREWARRRYLELGQG